jgi:hypothetical protein
MFWVSILVFLGIILAAKKVFTYREAREALYALYLSSFRGRLSDQTASWLEDTYGKIVLYSSIAYAYSKLRLRYYILSYIGAGCLESITNGAGESFHEIGYYSGGDRYVLRFPKNRGPGQVSSVVGSGGEDLTEQIKMYMGASKNFHGIPTTPKLLGFDKLVFIMRVGPPRPFVDSEVIVVS